MVRGQRLPMGLIVRNGKVIKRLVDLRGERGYAAILDK